MRDAALASLRELVEVVDRLRAPGGCPWDREQTHHTLKPYLLEETYELLDAIDGGDNVALREELGDLLLQVLMHSAIAAEDDAGFDIGDVAEVNRAKMVHRHPHVFAGTAVNGAAEVVVNWERLKRAEKGARLSILDGVPHALPALAHAQAVQKRPARLGFDETPEVGTAIGAVRDAVDRLEREAAAVPRREQQGRDWAVTEGEIRRGDASGSEAIGAAPADLERAVGELLFAVVALSRRLRVNAEDALRARTNAFAARYRRLEMSAKADGVDLHDIDTAEWRRRWEAAAASDDA